MLHPVLPSVRPSVPYLRFAGTMIISTLMSYYVYVDCKIRYGTHGCLCYYNVRTILRSREQQFTVIPNFLSVFKAIKKQPIYRDCTHWNGSVLFHESAEGQSCGVGMKSWYLSFQAGAEACVGDVEVGPCLIITGTGSWVSCVDCEVHGCSSVNDSLSSM